MVWKKRGSVSPKAGDISTLIDEGTEIDGKFTFTGTALVNGRLRGEVISNDRLIVGEKGVVNASVRAGVVRIAGEIVGNVMAGDRVELLGTGRVYGDIHAPVVLIEEGALLEGRCQMVKPAPIDPAAVSRDATVVPFKRSEAPR